jgi:hypothetical protein
LIPVQKPVGLEPIGRPTTFLPLTGTRLERVSRALSCAIPVETMRKDPAPHPDAPRPSSSAVLIGLLAALPRLLDLESLRRRNPSRPAEASLHRKVEAAADPAADLLRVSARDLEQSRRPRTRPAGESPDLLPREAHLRFKVVAFHGQTALAARLR